jgi:hypothetical protein
MAGTRDPCLFARGNTADISRIKCGLIKKQLRDCKTTNRVNKVLAQYYPTVIEQPLIQHEVHVLTTLQKYGISPKVIDVGSDYFIMSYCGQPVTKETKFTRNLHARIKFILKSLDAEKITHNDLRRDFRNYTELNGVLYLIDFQVSDIGDVTPGAEIRKGKEKFYNNNKADLDWFAFQFKKET